MFLIGFSGSILSIIHRYKKSKESNILIIHENNFAWVWLCSIFIISWLFTTIIPNKDPRYIAANIPIAVLILSRGWLEWAVTGKNFLRRRFKFLLLLPILSTLATFFWY